LLWADGLFVDGSSGDRGVYNRPVIDFLHVGRKPSAFRQTAKCFASQHAKSNPDAIDLQNDGFLDFCA
jgi:hypothetical protein